MGSGQNDKEKVFLNQDKVAAALGFDSERDDAPKVLASGKGHIAQKIVELANENNLPVYKDERLAHQLQNLEIGEAIPPELYHCRRNSHIYRRSR